MLAYYIFLASVAIISCFLAICTSFLHCFSSIYFLSVMLSLAVSAILFLRWKVYRKKIIIWALSVLLIITAAYGYSEIRNTKLHGSYFYGETAFDNAARRVLPELNSVGNIMSMEHRHDASLGIGWPSLDYADEWISLKVTYDEINFQEQLSQTTQRYTFYEKSQIDETSFWVANNPFEWNGYQFYFVVLPPDLSTDLSKRYVATIGFNMDEQSIFYLFIESGDFGFMYAEESIEFILRKYE